MGRIALLLACWSTLAWARPDPARTAVLVNADQPAGLAIAREFMTHRGIPAGNLISLPLGRAETLEWKDYATRVLGPLRARLLAAGLLEGQLQETTDPRGRAGFIPTGAMRLQWLVLVHGVPLKMAPSGIKGLNPANPVKGDHASLDSELALLALPNLDPEGARPNPWFGREDAASDGVIRVARLDGASPEAVLRAVRGAWEAEAKGLRGRAYVDLGGPYLEGDAWFRACLAPLREMGFAPDLEETKEPFPATARGDAPAFYLGWYSQKPNGKFGQKATRLAPGAIALHLHSFSGASLHNPTETWAPWLVEQGAGLTFGNVYEPYLSLTIRPERLLEGLQKGLSAGEAAWCATPAVSWQGIILGDPFYQPFAVPLETQVKGAPTADPLVDYALLRQFNLLPRPLGPEDLRRLREAAERSGRLALLLECARAEQAAGLNRPWRDARNLAAEEGGLLQEAARFAESRYGAPAAQKLRAELAKRTEGSPSPAPAPEKPVKR